MEIDDAKKKREMERKRQEKKRRKREKNYTIVAQESQLSQLRK